MLALLPDGRSELLELLLLGLLNVLVLLGLQYKQLSDQKSSVQVSHCVVVMRWRQTYLFTLGPALGGSGRARLVGGAVSVASSSHGESGGLGDAGERRGRDTEERHVVKGI